VDDLLTQQNGFQDIQLQLIQESLANKECAFLEAEYVIAGGGTAGCIMAEKLAKAGHTVILLESGVVQDEDVLLDDPKNSGVLVNQHTNRFFLMAGHDKQLPSPSHRRLPLVHGNVMGGGSAVNGMQHGYTLHLQSMADAGGWRSRLGHCQRTYRL
jgi:choline dehydrogenase